MITVNSTILSYNKIDQVQEQIPIPLPDSYIFEEKKSAQKLIPDLYDLDRLEDDNIYTQRNSTPILRSKNGLRNNYFNSVLMDKSDINIKNYNTNKVPVKVMQPNIYSNFDDDEYMESIKDSKEIYVNDNNIKIIKKEKENNNINNIYQNETHKISDDIINNININKNIIIKSKKDDCKFAKSGIYNQNLNIDANSTNHILHTEASNNNKLNDKSIRSAFGILNYKNIMKKDPVKNIITINTSLYKHRKRKASLFSINSSMNDNSKNSINNYLKFEEENNKEQNSINSITKNNNNGQKLSNKNNLKQEVLKSFRNSNSIFDLSNNSQLQQEDESNNNSSKLKNNDEHSNLNNYFNIEENDNSNNNININLYNHVSKNPQKNNLEKYNFKTEKNSLQINGKQNNSLNQRFSAMSSRKFNFDCPKKIITEEYSKENKSMNNQKISFSLIPLVKINFKGLKKILKKDGLFNVLTFLNDTDLISLLKSNKSLILLINRTIADAFFSKIKENLIKYKNIFELLKCSLIYTQLKQSFKIDFVINIRFVNQNKIKNDNTTEELTPKCYQLLFFYQCLKPSEPNAKLKTKETTKKIKMYDYYTFDLYPNEYRFPNIYITKESQQLPDQTKEEKLVYIQPILPFKYNDKGIINFEIYSSKNNFIDPSSIKVIMKQFDLKNYINELNMNNYNNLRICEYEDISAHWKPIENEKNNIFGNLEKNIKEKFEPNFLVESISYINIGFFLYKIILEAKRPGIIDRNKFANDLGINLVIKRKYENVENEIKKNNLIIERRQIFELRVGDKIMIYISVKKYKSSRKK